jgi:hypothetical protein
MDLRVGTDKNANSIISPCNAGVVCPKAEVGWYAEGVSGLMEPKKNI